MNNFISKLTITLFISLFLFAFTKLEQNDEWIVPESAKNVKNPTSYDDSEGKSVGKSLWNKHCKSCHGKEGFGDGSKAEELETFPGDFSTEEFQTQTDGSLFYKLTEGRDDMPEFTKKIPDEEDRWFLVNYMRGLTE